MKTEVNMKRELFGGHITQKSKSELFSATDLVKAGNKWRRMNGEADFNFSAWLKYKQTREFTRELEERFGKVIIKSKGKGTHTWFHPLLFIDLALAMSPRLKIEVYQWLFDQLLKYRNQSGDSYNNMCGALYKRHANKKKFSDYITSVAREIRILCKVTDWQTATEEQLERRDTIHKEIALLAHVLKSNEQAVRIVFDKQKKEILSSDFKIDEEQAAQFGLF